MRDSSSPGRKNPVMRKQFRLFRCTRLVAAAVLLAMGTGAAAHGKEEHAIMAMNAAAPAAITRTVKWSDASAWPSGKVPAAGETVTIPRGTEVLLDESPPELRSITVEGKLTFADQRDLALTTDWIYVPGGELQLGTEAKPFTHNATITLTDNVPGEDINTMGDRGIMLQAGTLSLHGDRTNAWTKLTKTAKAGTASIEVLNAAGWRKGDT